MGETLCYDDVIYCPCCNNEYYRRDYGGDYMLHEGEYICGDCIRQEPVWYIDHITNDYNVCNIFLSEDTLIHHGFEKLDKGDVGMYRYNTNVYPKFYYDKYSKEYDVLFHLDSRGNPFQTEFSVWGRKHDEE